MRQMTRWLPFLMLVPLWLTTLVIGYLAERQVRAEIHERLSLALYAHEQHIETVLASQRQRITLFGGGALTHGVVTASGTRVPNLRWEPLARFLPEALGCVAFDTQGTLMGHTGAASTPPFSVPSAGWPTVTQLTVTDPQVNPADSSAPSTYDLLVPFKALGIHDGGPWDGTLICRVTNILSPLLAEHRQGLQLTGEVYLVSGSTRRMLTDSRFLPDAVGRVHVDTVGVQTALTGTRGVAAYLDYRGTPVIGAFLPLHDSRWILLAEMDEAEALAPLLRLHLLFGGSLVGLSLVAWGVGRQYGREQDRLWAQLVAAKDQAAETAVEAKSLIAAALDAVVQFDPQLTIHVANAATHQLFGWPPDSLLGRSVTDLLAPLDQDRLRRAVTQLRSQEPLLGTVSEVTGIRKDGRPFPCAFSLADYQVPGRGRQFVGVLSDRSAQKRGEAVALRHGELVTLRYLLEGIAQGLKTPLFLLQGRLDLLREKLDLPLYEALRGDVAKTFEAITRLSQALDQFARVTNSEPPTYQPCSVHVALDEAEILLGEEFARGQIRVIRVIDSGLPFVFADPQEFQRIVLILLRNALDAMAAQGYGTLVVTAKFIVEPAPRLGPPIAGQAGRSPTGGWVELRVEDDGSGIAPEHRVHLFEPFFTTKGSHSRVGIGLWTLRAIVQSLHGTLSYETEEGIGTTFIVRLPAMVGRPPSP